MAITVTVMLFCTNITAQNKATRFALEKQTLKMSRSLKRHLALDQEKMCDIQLILFDHFLAFYESGLSNADSLKFKEAQIIALNDVEKVLTAEQQEKYLPIKEFYINASMKEKKMQNMLNVSSRNYDQGKIIDITNKIQKIKKEN